MDYCMAATQQNLCLWHTYCIEALNQECTISVYVIKKSSCTLLCLPLPNCMFRFFCHFVFVFFPLCSIYLWCLVVLLFVVCVLLVLESFLASWLKYVLFSPFLFPWLLTPPLPTFIIVSCGKFIVWGFISLAFDCTWL